MKIGIVILNYLNYEDTIKCINSLERQSFKNYQIVVIDNMSNNGSIEQLQKLYFSRDDIDILQMPENIGFAKANNFGISYLKREKNIFDILVINADTFFLDDHFLEKLVSLDYDDNCAMIGPSIIGSDGINQNPYFPMSDNLLRINNLRKEVKKRIFKFRIFPMFIYGIVSPNNPFRLFIIISSSCLASVLKAINSESIYLDLENQSLHGAAIFFTRNYLKKYIGFFPETFLYTEEDYLALLCDRIGMSQYYAPILEIQHKEGSSSLSASGQNAKRSEIRRLQRILHAIDTYENNLKTTKLSFINKFKEIKE